MTRRNSISIDDVLAQLRFDELSGSFIRLSKVNQAPAGSVAGTLSDSGARQIKIRGIDVMDYDLAWFVTRGKWPTGKVVPADGDRSNCRPENLMEIHVGSELTAELLRAVVDYDPETGVFRWKTAVGSRAKRGEVAGCVGKNGYVFMHVIGKHQYAHRLAWLYVYGVWPSGQIDHINGCRVDNRICNLRDVSHTANCENKRKALPNNKTGLLGVSWSAVMNKYLAAIVSGGVTHRLGYFDDKHEAHAAYVAAKRQLHQACTI